MALLRKKSSRGSSSNKQKEPMVSIALNSSDRSGTDLSTASTALTSSIGSSYTSRKASDVLFDIIAGDEEDGDSTMPRSGFDTWYANDRARKANIQAIQSSVPFYPEDDGGRAAAVDNGNNGNKSASSSKSSSIGSKLKKLVGGNKGGNNSKGRNSPPLHHPPTTLPNYSPAIVSTSSSHAYSYSQPASALWNQSSSPASSSSAAPAGRPMPQQYQYGSHSSRHLNRPTNRMSSAVTASRSYRHLPHQPKQLPSQQRQLPRQQQRHPQPQQQKQQQRPQLTRAHSSTRRSLPTSSSSHHHHQSMNDVNFDPANSFRVVPSGSHRVLGDYLSNSQR